MKNHPPSPVLDEVHCTLQTLPITDGRMTDTASSQQHTTTATEPGQP